MYKIEKSLEIFDVVLVTYLFANTETAEFKKAIKDDFNERMSWNKLDAGMSLDGESGKFLIALAYVPGEYIKPGIIAHEATHTSDHIFKFLATPKNESTQEIYALLVEYITQFIFEYAKSKGCIAP